MLTRLGAPAPAAADAADLLVECHGRIRAFLALARRMAEAGPEERDQLPEAAERVRRYFVEALPLHAEDEERSVLPRLRGRDPAVDAELAAMAREHEEHAAPLRALLAACDALGREPSRHAELAPAVLAATAALERHFDAHLAREEAVIFPALRLLPSEERAAIAREMRARREPPQQR
ncbi:MAG TPA: hemerythrin domain-containing protein [Anaeromyxobacteraceae bacterium]|nr:hemerythrin domain-containing protein [Anaeromyxobacteraceae bacterium]